MAKNNKTFYIIIFLTFIITAISYRTYMKNGWYDLDDYYTFEFAPAGSSILESSKATTDFLYREQGRFQPVRLYIFVALTHIFDEDSSVYYNFALHLVNILLLFLLLRKFRAGSIFSLISVLLFAVFGRFRYMDSSSVMIGGSGLNLLFILLTFLFLIKSLEAPPRRFLKRYAYLFISFLAYVSLIFSYEVAVPLFAPLVAVFYLFNRAGKGLLGPLRTKKSSYLLLYFIPLFIYIVFFRLFVKVDYEGAEIVWSLNILTRLKAYLLYTLFPPFPTEVHGLITAEFIILILYFSALILAMKRPDGNRVSVSDKRVSGLRLLLFSIVFYPSTVILFTLNNWEVPTSVMVHHTYLMTAAGAVLLAAFFYNLQWVFPQRLRKKYPVILAVFIFPLFLLNGEYNTVRYYKNDSHRVNEIKNIKKGIEALIPDVDSVDAVLFRNLSTPYYHIPSMDGALLKWFKFKKHIISGRDIISVRGDDIVFKGPLSIYVEPTSHKAKNDRVRIFFVSPIDGELLPYHYFVDLKRRLNIYQIGHVKEDWQKDGVDERQRLEAILSNFKKNNYLNIWFKSNKGLQNFAKSHTSIEVNDELVPDDRMTLSGDRLSIDISGRTKKINYFFLKVLSSDDRFKSTIRLIALTGSLP